MIHKFLVLRFSTHLFCLPRCWIRDLCGYYNLYFVGCPCLHVREGRVVKFGCTGWSWYSLQAR